MSVVWVLTTTIENTDNTKHWQEIYFETFICNIIHISINESIGELIMMEYYHIHNMWYHGVTQPMVKLKCNLVLGNFICQM